MVIFQKPVPGLSESSMTRFVTRAARSMRLHGTVNILITTSHEVRKLNRRFRHKDEATDVLSFPPLQHYGPPFAGDVAISADIAVRNARNLGHAAAAEIKVLALHGMLHLAGYDHETDEGEMARVESRLRQSLRLPAVLTERAGATNTIPRTGERSARSRP